MILAILISLAAGGFITSTVEYLKDYNLIDLIVEKVKSLLGKGEAEAKKIEAKVEWK